MIFHYFDNQPEGKELRIMDEAQPFPFLTLALFELVLSISLPIPKFRFRGLFLVMLLFSLYIRIILSSTRSSKSDWSLALSITPQLGKAIDMLILTNAESMLRKKGDSTVHPNEFPLWKKMCWSFENLNTPRGVGWNWETPYICYSGCASRKYHECYPKHK